MSHNDSASSIFRLDHNCCALAQADRVALLVDGEAYFEAFMRAAEGAQRSIVILAWDFNSQTPLEFDASGKPTTQLGQFLNRLAHRRRRLHIYVLDWDYPMIFGTGREFPPIYGLSWKPHRRVHFHYDATHPTGGSHHQKIVVIDDKLAFLGGFDLTSKRWDTRKHDPNDPRRLANGGPYPPFHDMMIALDAEAARAVAAIARKRWAGATGRELRPVEVQADSWPATLQPDLTDVTVGIACTSPPTSGGDGVRDVEQLYLDMIARARRYIYIENQYFTAHRIGEALAQRLQEPEGPEVVLVTRLLSHGWLEEMTMEVLRTKLIRDLRAADRNQRFDVYYPHVEGLREGTCVDVHSKAMVVDDEWLRIGSSNLSNRSMGMDTECDAVVEAGGDPRVSQAIRRFRDAALAEHLGVSPEDVAREIDRSGSMRAAIRALGSPARTLQPIEDVPEYSDAVLATAAVADPERPVSLDALVQQFRPDLEPSRSGPAWGKVGIAALVILGLTLVWRYTPLAEMVTGENVAAWAERFAGYWWAPLAIVLFYTPASLVMFPRPVITLSAVVAFGPWLGFAYAMAGILSSASVHYVGGRMLSRDTVRRLAGERLNRMTCALQKRGLLAVTAIRLVPLAPFAVEGAMAGAIRIKFWHFLVGTFLGLLPGVLAATVFGSELQAALKDPSKINYWLVGGVVLLLVVATLFVRRWLTRLEADHDNAQPGSARAPAKAGAPAEASAGVRAATRARQKQWC